jgi:MFS transporter, AAHS family, 4-hydroxybenzoate transporter
MFYPTRMRATGVGWCLGAGRVGGMFGPMLGGLALAQHWTVLPSFLVIAVPTLIAGTATFSTGLVASARHPVEAVAKAAE